VAGDVQGDEERAWRLVVEQVDRYRHGEPLINVLGEGY
jgi:hypothetical protein